MLKQIQKRDAIDHFSPTTIGFRKAANPETDVRTGLPQYSDKQRAVGDPTGSFW
jgi:hypothetical protein